MKMLASKDIKTQLLLILLGAGVILYAVYLLFASHSLTYDANPTYYRKVIFVIQRILVGLLFFIAIINISKLKIKESWIAWIIFTGLLARLILIPSSPVLEDDFYRYLWDGAVTASDFNPYVFSPQDVMDKKNDVPEKILKLSDQSGHIIHKINHPKMKTLYPSMAQIVFAISYILFPWSVTGWKFVMLFGDLFLLFFIIKILNQLKLPISYAAIYWLNPVVLHEFFNTMHYDLFALLFTAISIYYFLKDEYITSSILLALAVGFKLWPVLLFPFMLRKISKQKWWAFSSTAVFLIFIVIIFIPVLRAGMDENEGFVKYASNWINNAAVYTLLTKLIDWFTTTFKIYYVCADCVARWITGGIILTSTLILIRKPIDSFNLMLDKFLIIVALMFFISPTQFPWYLTWVILPLVFSPKISLLMYMFLIPLYHLHYTHQYFVYIQHIPVILMFIYEIKTNASKLFFKNDLTFESNN